MMPQRSPGPLAQRRIDVGNANAVGSGSSKAANVFLAKLRISYHHIQLYQ